MDGPTIGNIRWATWAELDKGKSEGLANEVRAVQLGRENLIVREERAARSCPTAKLSSPPVEQRISLLRQR